MRSRYAAYALQLADYIIQTTHPSNSSYSNDVRMWRREILQFCSGTRFEGLKVVEFVDGRDKAIVTFTAYLKQGRDGSSRDATFTEKSDFVKVGERWLYTSGTLVPTIS
jgi:SEC-C motif-containing protein